MSVRLWTQLLLLENDSHLVDAMCCAMQCADEESEFHGAELKDYMERSFVSFAVDADRSVPEKCFAPKKLLHTWYLTDSSSAVCLCINFASVRCALMKQLQFTIFQLNNNDGNWFPTV